MLASITPLGERGRNNRFAVTAVAYTVGAAAGGVTIGALAGLAGALLAPSAGLSAALVALVALGAAAVDLSRRSLRLPTIRRQVNEDWLTAYRGWVYGLGFGFQLGLAVVTIVTTAAVYAALIDAVLTGSLLGGALVGGAFGLTRGLMIFLGARVQGPEQLTRVHRAFAARSRTASTVTVATEAVVFAAAVTFILGAS